MQVKEYEITATDGIVLYVKVFLPESNPVGLICLTHGFAEHCGRFEHVAESFTKAGYIFYTFDLRGHGKSGGKRGYTPSYNQLMEDLELILKDAQNRYPLMPCYLYGHSMGGNIVLNFLIRKKPELKGAIITSPWLELTIKPRKLEILFAKIMNRIYPSFSINNKNKIKGLSHDPQIEIDYFNDPLVSLRITPRLFIGIVEAGYWAMDHADGIEVPFLLMHGSSDKTTSFDASKKFSESVIQPHTFKAWDGMYHELHNEIIKNEVLKYLVDWVESN